MSRVGGVGTAALVALALLARAGHEAPTPTELTTWSLAAVDPATGDVGVAAASCVDVYGDALAALVPGRGAGVTQAAFNLDNRNRVYQAIRDGLDAGAVIAAATDPAADADLDNRQYGVVTLDGSTVRAASFTSPARRGRLIRDGRAQWAGGISDAASGVSVQGNILVSEDVVVGAFEAFGRDDAAGFNTLADRLMRGLEAGSAAGGDARCNDATTRQTASMAFILVARNGDPPYAAADIGVTDQGTGRAPWLSISVRSERGGDNPLPELRLRYDRWRRTAAAR